MTNLYRELEVLTQKIENNTAELNDYKRYELLLEKGGLNSEYIFSYLNRAGFNNWNQLIEARKNKEKKETSNAVVVGSIIGLGIALLLTGILGKDKE
ncbi:hypothetical protein F7642_12385 [Tenacibaculum finnmarkense genomovar ulcerans]|uniref:hypothetical protein n=1 Tax=Tenacibaculum finnmarkense TaxID=2781243 RepID=UPI00187B5911|nr:hypothetical protein [Tenacibaculum finnmarkense]MBE7635122.1 hypothetical protein [Tenacibaculum finnmarkense genomovar ulcerans]MCD8431061.1 hypothetical protein [Tenacibaculum finnmarkense genomovar ulcerans]